MKTLPPRTLGLICALIAFLADQGSKVWLLYGEGFAHMAPGDTVPVLPFFNLVMVWNPGISYGLFAAQSPWGTWALVGLCIAAVAGLGWWMWTTASRPAAAGLGLIIGGAIGNNLVDRVLYGRVADFFYFHGFGHGWYVFNIADLAICLGAAAIIYDVLRPAEPAGEAKRPEDA